MAKNLDARIQDTRLVGSGTLTLIGGGDRVLTTADLTTLASSAIAALKQQGVTSVKVHVDDSLFPAPTLAAGWNDGYYDGSTIAPVRALVVDEHSVMDTSVDAGQVFAAQLAAQGLIVTGDVAHGQATGADSQVAVRCSTPLTDIIHHMLKVSDNDIAETLLRMTAIGAGQPATFDGGTAVVRHVLTDVLVRFRFGALPIQADLLLGASKPSPARRASTTRPRPRSQAIPSLLCLCFCLGK